MAKDIIHQVVKNALIKDGWNITHDPYTIRFGNDKVYADLAAERPIAAEKSGSQIIIEVKSFIGRSSIQDFEDALGQYRLYFHLLARTAPQYKLYLAISNLAYLNVFQRDMIQFVVEQEQIPLIVVNIDREEIKLWIR